MNDRQTLSSNELKQLDYNIFKNKVWTNYFRLTSKATWSYSFTYLVAPKGAVVVDVEGASLAAGKLGDSLGPLADGMPRQLPRNQEPNSSMDISRRQGWPFQILCKSSAFLCETFKHVVHERIHYAHGFAGDTTVGMDLLQDLVDKVRITFRLSLPFRLGNSATEPGIGFRGRRNNLRRTRPAVSFFTASRGLVSLFERHLFLMIYTT